MAEPVPELEEGLALERALRWSEALRVYERVEVLPLGNVRLLEVRLRKANALMELGRMDEARREFDTCIEDVKAIDDPDLLGRTLVGAGVFAANTGDTARAEPFLLKALELTASRNEAGAQVTAGWAMVTLGGLYGRMGRLDLAFVTLQRARERLAALGDRLGVAASWETQGQLRRAMGDEDRWRDDLAEAAILYRRDGLHEKANRIQRLLGRKLV